MYALRVTIVMFCDCCFDEVENMCNILANKNKSVMMPRYET